MYRGSIALLALIMKWIATHLPDVARCAPGKERVAKMGKRREGKMEDWKGCETMRCICVKCAKCAAAPSRLGGKSGP